MFRLKHVLRFFFVNLYFSILVSVHVSLVLRKRISILSKASWRLGIARGDQEMSRVIRKTHWVMRFWREVMGEEAGEKGRWDRGERRMGEVYFSAFTLTLSLSESLFLWSFRIALRFRYKGLLFVNVVSFILRMLYHEILPCFTLQRYFVKYCRVLFYEGYSIKCYQV